MTTSQTVAGEETPGEIGYSEQRKFNVWCVAMHMKIRLTSQEHIFICWLNGRSYHNVSICTWALIMNCSCIFKTIVSQKCCINMSFYCHAVQTKKDNKFTFASCKICLMLQLAVSDSRMMCTYSLEYIFPPLSFLLASGQNKSYVSSITEWVPDKPSGKIWPSIDISAQHTEKLTVKQEYMLYFMLI